LPIKFLFPPIIHFFDHHSSHVNKSIMMMKLKTSNAVRLLKVVFSILPLLVNSPKAHEPAHEPAYDWKSMARPEQLVPVGNWQTWLILAGRGFGKTRTGAETIRDWVRTGKCKRIALISETESDARRVMIEGISGLLNVCPPSEQPRYIPSLNKLVWPNGAEAHIFSADRYESLRGPQFDGAWIDELSKFRYPQETWDQLSFALRLGDNPQCIITTTPKPIELIQ
jgi:phage terminase large subunit-like protein